MASKGTLSPELLLQLEILRAIPGTSSVNDFGVEGEGKPNTYGVLLKLQAPIVAGSQTEQKPLRVACSKDRATKLDAALQMKKNVAAIVGEDAVEQAESLIIERQAAAGGSTAPSTAFDVLALTQKLRAVVKSGAARDGGRAESPAGGSAHGSGGGREHA